MSEKLKDRDESIKFWENGLKKFREQASRSNILETDLIPLWLGATNVDCVEWIEEEIRLLKEVSLG